MDKIEELIKEYENEIKIEQLGGNVVKEAQARGIVMGLRMAQHQPPKNLMCPKCDGAEITSDELTAEEIFNVIEKHAEQFGYVKAPKNELVPLDETEVHKTLLQARKDWENDPHHMSGEMYQLSVETTAICSKFGSSGKRPISQKELKKVFDRFYDEIDRHHLDIIDAICKEFSTAEVSEEPIQKAIFDHLNPLFEDLNKNYPDGLGLLPDYNKFAKAIKAELDGK